MARDLNNKTHRDRPDAAHRGIILIEMAIVLPLLLLITFAVLEYGWMFTKSSEITNAVRHGTRIGVRPAATAADVTDAVASMMAKAGFEEGEYEVELDPADPTVLVPGEEFTVTVSVNYEEFIYITKFPLLPTPETVAATATMAKEGPPTNL